jgi:FdrA protein
MANEKLLTDQKLKVINIGLDSFFEDLKDLGVEVIHVDWRPPADGDSKLLDILDKLDSM